MNIQIELSNIKNSISTIALAISEQQRNGNLSPQTLKELQKIATKCSTVRYSDNTNLSDLQIDESIESSIHSSKEDSDTEK